MKVGMAKIFRGNIMYVDVIPARSSNTSKQRGPLLLVQIHLLHGTTEWPNC